MPAIGRNEAERIARQVTGLRGRARTAAVRREAELYGVTTVTVNRWLRRVGRRTRAVSSRKGKTRVREDDLAALAAAISSTSTAKDGKSIPLLTVHRAAEILVENGHESLGNVRPDRLAALLRERGLSRRGIRDLRARPPRVRIRTSHPNQVHLVDATHCVRFFFGRSGLVFRQDLERAIYKNKPAAVRAIYGPDGDDRIWRHVVVDHTSSAFYVRYYQVPGENPATTVDFLMAAWRTKPGFEFHGVPLVLYSDKGIGTLGAASPVRRFCENLGVKCVAHAPGNPAAKGAVESLMAYWEREFEGPLALQPAFNLTQLNAWALEHAVYLQGTRIHSRHGRTRLEAWRAILPEQLRELPQGEEAERELRRIATFKPVERRVTDDGLVRFGGREWRVPTADLHGRHVLVYRDFWDRSKIKVALAGKEDAERYSCDELARGEWGFYENAVEFGTYRRLRDTGQQKAYKAALRAGPEALKDVNVYGHHGDSLLRRGGYEGQAESTEDGGTLAMPRRGEEIAPHKTPPERTVSNTRARELVLELLDERGIEPDTEVWAVLDEDLGAGEATEASARAAAERIVRLRLSSGHEEERTA